ncbi:hypothetical protein [uncultured Methanoregula sp.]|uniref:hypothetical protein n=1 Tax=uncultured Methanoregula sp. TaxID=1005933 RepID=UPI002AAC42C6|nr:hypothetical protein [uncultured Methanoregula sp.]
MKPDCCAEITDAKRIETKSGLTEPGEHRNAGFIIPACILIGIGVGLLVNNLGSGFLIGLGLGLAGSELLPFFKKPLEGEGHPMKGVNVTTLLIGAFIVFIGIGIVFVPAAIWPYAIAGFLILAGISFLVRGINTL